LSRFFIQSKGIKYYIGQTEDLDRRLMEHNSHSYQDSYVKIASD